MARVGDILLPILGALAGASSPAAGRGIASAASVYGGIADRRAEEDERERSGQLGDVLRRRLQAAASGRGGLTGYDEGLLAASTHDPIGTRGAILSQLQRLSAPVEEPEQTFTVDDLHRMQSELPQGMSRSGLPTEGGGRTTIRHNEPEIPPMLERPDDAANAQAQAVLELIPDDGTPFSKVMRHAILAQPDKAMDLAKEYARTVTSYQRADKRTAESHAATAGRDRQRKAAVVAKELQVVEAELSKLVPSIGGMAHSAQTAERLLRENPDSPVARRQRAAIGQFRNSAARHLELQRKRQQLRKTLEELLGRGQAEQGTSSANPPTRQGSQSTQPAQSKSGTTKLAINPQTGRLEVPR